MLGEDYNQMRTMYLTAGGALTAGSNAFYDVASIDALIAHVNKIFFDLPVNRTNYYYLEQDYRALMNVQAYLTSAQIDGINGKFLSYQERLRSIESGQGDPMTATPAIVTGDGYAPGPLPGLPVTGTTSTVGKWMAQAEAWLREPVSVFSLKIPKWIYLGGAAASTWGITALANSTMKGGKR